MCLFFGNLRSFITGISMQSRLAFIFMALFTFATNAASEGHQDSLKVGDWRATVQTSNNNAGNVRSCLLIASPSDMDTSPTKAKSKNTDLMIAIIRNGFKDKERQTQHRIQLIQTQDSKIKYFDKNSKGTLRFVPSNATILLNDNLKVGVGSFNFSDAEFKEFKSSFQSASELIVDLSLTGGMIGKVVFDLKGSAKAMTFLNKSCGY